MDLEGTLLIEVSHTEKDKFCVISLICGILKKESKLVNIIMHLSFDQAIPLTEISLKDKKGNKQKS